MFAYIHISWANSLENLPSPDRARQGDGRHCIGREIQPSALVEQNKVFGGRSMLSIDTAFGGDVLRRTERLIYFEAFLNIFIPD
jgi:hypothetical protein